jgi:hypothetical protein
MKRSRVEHDAWVLGIIAENKRLQKLFDDASNGQYDVLALIDYYQEEMFSAKSENAKMRGFLDLIDDEIRGGCDCHSNEHITVHPRCLACRVGSVLAKAAIALPSGADDAVRRIG